MSNSSITVAIAFLGLTLSTIGKAEAAIYNFSNFNPGGGSISASGFFDINDTSNTGILDLPGELVDWNITISDSVTSQVLTSDNSTIDFGEINGNPLTSYLSDVSINSTLVDFGDADRSSLIPSGFRIKSNDSLLTQLMLTTSSTNSTEVLSLSDVTVGASVPIFDSLSLTANAASVPFEFSPSLGLITMASIFGISYLKKQSK